MIRMRSLGIALLLAVFAQGCATTKTGKVVAKKKVTPPRQNQSFALMDETVKLDAEILKRGNRARGLAEY